MQSERRRQKRILSGMQNPKGKWYEVSKDMKRTQLIPMGNFKFKQITHLKPSKMKTAGLFQIHLDKQK